MGRDQGVIIVAIKQTAGDTRFNPTFQSRAAAGDTLVALGVTVTRGSAVSVDSGFTAGRPCGGRVSTPLVGLDPGEAPAAG